jgi:hypothetical protein
MCSPDSKYTSIQYRLFDKYTETLGLLLDDDSFWLNWYLWENGNGRKGNEAMGGHGS